MRRRQFLAGAAAAGAAASLGPAFWRSALAAPAQPGDSPYGPLLPPDANGVMLPEGFTSRIVASGLVPVAGTGYVWHPFPDGGACLPAEEGGWLYISNSENPPPVDVPGATALVAQLAAAVPDMPLTGGVSVLRFDRDGAIVGAHRVLEGAVANCAGGLTPWGTWLSCEEWEDVEGYDAGRVWECDPTGSTPAVARPALGRFKHEMATVDPVRQQLYLTEDQPDGLVYRYTPPPGTWGSGAALEGGVLEAMAVADDGSVSWLPVADFDDPTAPRGPLRHQVAGATPFDGGEGAVWDDGFVYVTTKGDHRVWVHDIGAQTMTVLYDGGEHAAPVLSGVDNIAVSTAHDLYVAEDGGNMEVCVISPERAVFPVVRLTGPQHGFDSGTPIPFISEVTGLALSPDGNRLYLGSQRGMGLPGLPVGPGPGILYEVTGPFRGGSLAGGAAPSDAPAGPGGLPADDPAPAGPGAAAPAPGASTLPATGGAAATGAAAAAAAAGAALWRLRQRAEP